VRRAALHIGLCATALSGCDLQGAFNTYCSEHPGACDGGSAAGGGSATGGGATTGGGAATGGGTSTGGGIATGGGTSTGGGTATGGGVAMGGGGGAGGGVVVLPCDGGPCEVDFTIASMAGAAGEILFNDGGLLCDAGTCALFVDAGTRLRVVATPFFPFGFSKWTGSVCNGTPDCTIAVVGPSTHTATFSPLNYAFVSEMKVMPGKLGGLDGGDALCNAMARDAGLPGNFHALLRVADGGLSDRFAAARGWILPNGRPFLDAMVDQTSMGNVVYPLRLDAHGVDILYDQIVMTGGNDPSAFNTCADWTDVNNDGGMTCGYAGSAAQSWYVDSFASYLQGCAVPARIYCLGTDYSAQLPRPTATGRFAFHSRNPFTPGTGFAGADAQCAADAADAGLPGMYRAVLGGETITPLSRFDAGLPWVRTDGVLFVDDPAKFLALQVPPTAPLWIDSVKQPNFNWVWAGTPGDSCADFLSMSSAFAANQGIPIATNYDWNGASGIVCSYLPGAYLYCLQR
jgi:hypothetical protein